MVDLTPMVLLVHKGLIGSAGAFVWAQFRHRREGVVSVTSEGADVEADVSVPFCAKKVDAMTARPDP
ncbi:hypothetical protein HLK56_31625 [Streptomyces sp. G9]|uniref:hypothetical protein n=1 Tax=Streptomyces sp. G9 TaxID=1684483 RepID=UPI003D753861